MTQPAPRTVIRLPSPRKADGSDDITLEQVDPVGRTEVMLYGKPGTGKTIMSCTFPGPFRIFDADRGTKSLVWALKEGKLSTRDPKDIVIFQPHEHMDGQYPDRTKLSAFDQLTDKADFWFSPEEVGKWNTLIIDSFTEINEWAINKGLYLNFNTKVGSGQLSISEKVNLAAKAKLLTGQQDYKSAMALCEGLLNDLRVECARFNKNLVVVCHEYVEEHEDDKGRTIVEGVYPLLIGQLRQRLVKSFDDVWYQTIYNEVGGPKVMVKLYGDKKYVAKTRWGSIVKTEEPADYRHLVEKVKAYHNG